MPRTTHDAAAASGTPVSMVGHVSAHCVHLDSTELQPHAAWHPAPSVLPTSHRPVTPCFQHHYAPAFTADSVHRCRRISDCQQYQQWSITCGCCGRTMAGMEPAVPCTSPRPACHGSCRVSLKVFRRRQSGTFWTCVHAVDPFGTLRATVISVCFYVWRDMASCTHIHVPSTT